MTQAKAQTVAAAIINGGFRASAFIREDGEWVVRAESRQFNIPIASAVALANAQGVVALLKDVEFS